MSQIIFILGESGSGKSTSLRNLKADDVNVVSVTGKALPLKTDIKVYHPKGGYNDVIKAVNSAKALLEFVGSSTQATGSLSLTNSTTVRVDFAANTTANVSFQVTEYH